MRTSGLCKSASAFSNFVGRSNRWFSDASGPWIIWTQLTRCFIYYAMLCKLPQLITACWQHFLFNFLGQCNECCWNSPTLLVPQEELSALILLIVWELNSEGSELKWILAITVFRNEVTFINEGICSTYKKIVHSTPFG
jgi:hypothetical protein